MKLLFDFFPILLFFITFKFYHIYVATAVMMVASLLQVSIYWLKFRRFESLHIVTLVLVLFLGGATLLLHDAMFIKWKPTVIYWVFALLFLATQFIGNKPLIRRLMAGKIELPAPIWLRLNLSWVVFFAVMGIINLYVVYNFSTNAWVNFKLFGTMGLTLVFVVIQSLYLAKHMIQKAEVRSQGQNKKPEARVRIRTKD